MYKTQTTDRLGYGLGLGIGK